MEGSPLLHWGIEAVRGWCYNMATASPRPLFYLNYLDMEKMGGSTGETQKLPFKGLYTPSALHWASDSEAGRGWWCCLCQGWPRATLFSWYVSTLFLEFIPLGGSV